MKPPNSTDARRAALIAELEATNQQLHALRQKATRIQQELTALKGSTSKPIPPISSSKKSTPGASSSSKAKSPKPLAKDDDLMLGGVSD